MTEKQKLKRDSYPPIQNFYLQTDFQFTTARTLEDCADYLLDWQFAKTPAGQIEHIEAFTVDERTIRYAILMTGHYQQWVWTTGTLNCRHDGQTMIRGQTEVALPSSAWLMVLGAGILLLLIGMQSIEAGVGLIVICLALALMWLISVRSMRHQVERILFSLKT